MSGVRHELIADGGVRLIVPASGVVTDADARRLAWAILNDLAPDEVVPVAQVVTHKEAQRLDILRAVANRAVTTRAIRKRLGLHHLVVQRRLKELVGDGRLTVVNPGPGGTAPTYSLSIEPHPVVEEAA